MKRLIAAGLAACTLALGSYTPAASAQTKLKLILNWKYQGPQAWFFIAQDKGYFKAEGVDIELDQGEGSGAPVGKIASGAYNAGFGDINAIINLAATKPQDVWTGLRPATPDGLPLLGRLPGAPEVIASVGHGMLGSTTSIGSAKLVAAVVAGNQPAIDIAALSPARFTRG